MMRRRRKRAGSSRQTATRGALTSKAMLISDACVHPKTGGPIGSVRWPTAAQLGYSMLLMPRRFCFATRTSYPAALNAVSPGTRAKLAIQSRRRTPTLQNASSSSTGSLARRAALTRQGSRSKSCRAHATCIANPAGSVIARRRCSSKCHPHSLGACFAATLLGEQRWQRQSARMILLRRHFHILPLRLCES